VALLALSEQLHPQGTPKHSWWLWTSQVTYATRPYSLLHNPHKLHNINAHGSFSLCDLITTSMHFFPLTDTAASASAILPQHQCSTNASASRRAKQKRTKITLPLPMRALKTATQALTLTCHNPKVPPPQASSRDDISIPGIFTLPPPPPEPPPPLPPDPPPPPPPSSS
jgi:hypothetical protein